MLSSLFMAAFAAQVADDGFSKLQIFLQQLIDWGVSAGGRIIGAVIIFVVGRFLISFLRKMLARLLAKRHVDASIFLRKEIKNRPTTKMMTAPIIRPPALTPQSINC